ncbi:MAG: DEAD/DEAH box helicase family protein, partial [Patescibacteria group bacterium]|nr:DEAD/DEAH box helicase family protein [Patescibacteria group bacterium]
NKIRSRVAKWKKNGYPGASRITLELLKQWNESDRERRLFFCQLEAAETIIWLTEAPASERQGIIIPEDSPSDPVSIEKGYSALKRYCCKMATGSGKTVVMAMIIAWSILNKIYNKQDKRFSDAVLVVCPNLTVKERLSVLDPSNDNSYYEKFNLVPPSLIPSLSKGRIMVTNWHLFQPEDDESKRGVVKRGPESDSAFCKRTLRELQSRGNILVINDEAHHAYRPAQHDDALQRTLEEAKEQESEFEEATVWINGLDRINNALGINFCVDMSATPYYLQGSGHEEGSPIPWIGSDFGLVDAIESGIVKIPRVPVDTNSGRPIPEYFELWKWIMEKLPWSERKTSRRGSKPEAVLSGADGALSTLASEWKKTFDVWQKDNSSVPPVMIAVCDNTNLSELLAEKVASGRVLPELKNEDGKEVTLRIDSKLINEAESRIEETKKDKAAKLREKVSTVGKEGQPGAPIRCVVSVGMLTEGWDAQNVTQILGLRAFKSQLLCEQVVGRGLRRTNYDDFTKPEYVDVYGIPFEVIPVAKSEPGEKQQTRLGTKVMALPERKNFEIRFPRVEGYIFDVRHKIICDVKSVP